MILCDINDNLKTKKQAVPVVDHVILILIAICVKAYFNPFKLNRMPHSYRDIIIKSENNVIVLLT